MNRKLLFGLLLFASGRLYASLSFAWIFLKNVSKIIFGWKTIRFGKSLEFINTVIWILILGAMILSYRFAPIFKLNLDKEPSYVWRK